jgi:sugar phosphate isomerase/epimerase
MPTAPLTRRSFLAGSAALAASAVLPRLAPAADADPFGGFTVGVQSYTFRNFDLDGMLKRTKELGLKFAEFYSKHIPMGTSGDKLKGFQKLLAEYGVTANAYGVQKFTKNHDDNKKQFEFGAELGIQAFSADPDPDSFDSLDKLCAEYKIAVAIHPHGPEGQKMHRWRDAEMILKAVKDHHALIGTCLDTGHLIRASQLNIHLDPVEQIKIMGARNFGLHLKDHDNKRKTDVPFGDPTGVLDVPGVLKALKAVKFAGSISIEYEANAANPTADVKACLDHMKAVVKTLG